MGVRDFIRNARKARAGGKVLPDVAMREAVRGLEQAIGQAGSESLEQPDEFVSRISSAWRDQGVSIEFSNRDLRGIAYHLHHRGERNTFSLADDADLVKHYLDLVSAKQSVLLTSRLTWLFLNFFGENAEIDARLGQILSETAAGPAPPEQTKRLFDAGLLDARSGPSRLSRLIDDSRDVEAVLEELMFDASLANSGFEAAAFKELCTDTVSRSSDPAELTNRVLTWARDALVPGEMRFPELAGVTADALLLPWDNANVNPSKLTEASIKQFLISALGDPRFSTSSARWSTVSEDAKIVLKRWMSRAAVTQFFDIVDATMDTPASKRMWRYRRAFWTSYLNEIEDAWVVFGTTGASMARRAAHQAEDKSLLQFGTFNTSGAVSTHAVLILTIGQLTIAEWSHNGRCWIWLSSSGAVSPYQRFYSVHSLRHADWDTTHANSEGYHWQRKIADKISYETGIKKSQNQYRV